jgi:hypothetical protein
MQLNEFCKDQKQLIDDFEAWYASRRKSKGLTMFRPVEQWRTHLREFLEIYDDGESNRPQDEDEEATTHKRKAA